MFKDKRILVTGACGTVGSELINQLLNRAGEIPSEIVALDNNESSLFFLDQKYTSDSRINTAITDIRDLDSLKRKMEGIDIVFHTAALKHVILSERSPEQAVQTNILGVQNVIEAANHNNVGRVIFTSSDKAVNPTNVMGTSKLMGERLMTAANSNRRNSDTIFSSTRFGNVLGSNGSVLQIFREQIRSGGPVTLTHRQMTRFVMSIQESVEVLINSVYHAKGGEILITKMPVVRIIDLAHVLINELAPQYGYCPQNVDLEIIGSKPGEKLYEELMSDEEMTRALELKDYFSVLPAFRGLYHDIDYSYENVVCEKVYKPYRSSEEQILDLNEVRTLLFQYGLLGEETFPTTNSADVDTKPQLIVT